MTDLPLEDTGKKRWGRRIYRFTEPWDYWYMDGMDLTIKVSIPRWAETDFASIPWPLHYLMRPDGPWKRAAVVHDYLCTNGTCRFLTDAIFRHMMHEDGVKLRWLIYYCVRAYWVTLGWWTARLRR